MHNRALARGVVHNGITLNSFPVKKMTKIWQKMDNFEKFSKFFWPFVSSSFFFSLIRILFFLVYSFLVYFGTFSLFFSFLHPTQFRVFSRRIHGAAGEGLKEEDGVRSRSRARWERGSWEAQDFSRLETLSSMVIVLCWTVNLRVVW